VPDVIPELPLVPAISLCHSSSAPLAVGRGVCHIDSIFDVARPEEQHMPNHRAPDAADEPPRSSEVAPPAGPSPALPHATAQGPQTSGSPITPEVLLASMGGPERSALQDTVHKVAMLSSVRWAGTLGKTAPERRPLIGARGAVAVTSAAGSFLAAVHWGWLPFL
jgi:hypothetical protein